MTEGNHEKDHAARVSGFGRHARGGIPGGHQTAQGHRRSARLRVYAAPLPGYDFTPVLPQIFEDLKYAGVDAVELMERALRHADSVEKIGELSRKHELPVIGTSYEGPM